MSGNEKINLSDSLGDIRNFFSDLVSRETKLKISSDGEYDGREVTFVNFIDSKGIVILSIPDEKLLINVSLI